MRHIILVRTPLEPIQQDPYHTTLCSHLSATPHHLPVLATTFLDHAALSSLISTGPDQRYSGVILTSCRSAEAWGHAASSTHSSWSSIPFFVVGPGTRDAVLRLNPVPSPTLLGAGLTGSGEKLSSFIVAHFGGAVPELPLLYLVGDKNRDTIPRMLGEAGIGLVKQQVYETCPAGDVEARLEEIIDRIFEARTEGEECPTIWFALFSPSGAKHCLGVLRTKDMLRCRREREELAAREQGELPPRIKLAAIGPTTRAYVEGEEGLFMHAVASSPDPLDLIRAMMEGREEEDE